MNVDIQIYIFMVSKENDIDERYRSIASSPGHSQLLMLPAFQHATLKAESGLGTRLIDLHVARIRTQVF